MKSIAVISLLMLALSAQAQIGKGKNILSGNITYNTSSMSGSASTYEQTNSYLTAMPRYGHLFGEKTEVGISIGYEWINNKTTGTGTTTKNSTGLFLVGPYVRWYQNLAEHFYFSFTAAASFNIGSDKSVSTNSFGNLDIRNNITEFQLGVSPGLTFFYNDHWAANFGIGLLNYTSSKRTNDSTDESTTTNTFNAGINSGGLVLGIGLYF